MAPGAALFEVPNLDGLEPAELRAASGVFVKLCIYAEFKATAMELRAAGDIPAALRTERAADRTYAGLPRWAKR